MATFTVTNTNDSGAGSLRQAILDSNAAGGSNTIDFDPSLLGQTITVMSVLPLNANAIINADINNDNATNDITIFMDQNTALFSFDTAGVSLDNNYSTINYDIDDIFGNDGPRGAIQVMADNATFSNNGIINTAGVDSFLGDRGAAIRVQADNFTLNNAADASIISAGRSAVESISYIDNNTGNFLDSYTVVNNAGLLEATDDTVRLTNGLVTNSGTIRTTGTFDFGGNLSIPGNVAEAIAMFGPQDANYSGPVSHVVNTATGLIEGARSGVGIYGGGILNNAGTVTGEVAAVWTNGGNIEESTFAEDFILNNTGTITRTGENYGFNFNDVQGNGYAAIIVASGLDSATITNSGTINSTDIAISAFNLGTTLINEAAGVINSNTDGIDADGIGDDGLAFYGAELEVFEVLASVSTIYANPNQIFVNEQGITVDSNSNFVVPGAGTVSPPSGGSIEVAYVGGDNPLLPLVDIAATQAAGSIVFQTDANGVVYPAVINVPSAVHGTLVVSYVSGSGFDITDTNGVPVYNVPDGVDFGDTIENQGTINGDIVTGLGDDMVENIAGMNTGFIFGNIDTGRGDDTVVNSGTIDVGIVDTGEGNDIITNNGFLFHGLDAGDGDDLVTNSAYLTGDIFLGAGNDIFTDTNLSSSSSNNSNIDAGSGNDVIMAGTNDDTIDGGDGFDIAVYAGAPSGYSFSESGGIVTVQDTLTSTGADDGTDTLTNVEFIRFHYNNPNSLGANYTVDSLLANNVINGTINNNVLVGTSGADIINASAGDDILRGNNGNDTLNGASGNDRLLGGAGADALNGGSGNDTAAYSSTAIGIRVNLATGEATGGHAEGDILTSIENLSGTSGDDVLTGNHQVNILNGRVGDDALYAGGGASNELYGELGDDRLFSGTGADTLNGGSGADDWADYSLSTESVTVRINNGGVSEGGYAEGDIQIAIENIQGSDFDDVLTGNGIANELNGGAGNDVFSASTGHDIINGGSGNDFIVGARGADIIDGGSGIDTASYSNSDNRVIVDLIAGSATGSGHGSGDVLTSIENIFGSRYNDDIYGDDNNNVLEGSLGIDELFGRGGDDTLIGGGGVDYLDGGTGNDILTGGGGYDRFLFDTQDFGQDHITDFSNNNERIDFRGSGLTFADLLIDNSSGSTVITIIGDTDGNSITLDGVTSLIDANDFIF